MKRAALVTGANRVIAKTDDGLPKLRLAKSPHSLHNTAMPTVTDPNLRAPRPKRYRQFINWVSRSFPRISCSPSAMTKPGRKLFLNGRVVHLD